METSTLLLTPAATLRYDVWVSRENRAHRVPLLQHASTTKKQFSPGPKVCSKCHAVAYCSAACQEVDWTHFHAKECSALSRVYQGSFGCSFSLSVRGYKHFSTRPKVYSGMAVASPQMGYTPVHHRIRERKFSVTEDHLKDTQIILFNPPPS